MTLFERSHDGDVVRLDFEHNHDEWKIGQHFFLCFPNLTLWQSHPMTPLNVPGQNPRGQSHTYIIRSRKGITKQLADIARNAQLSATSPIPAPTTSVVLSGPYGQSILSEDFYREDDVNVMCVAGGTGVTFVLPVLLALTRTPRRGNLEFVWAIRRKDDLKWIEPELQTLRRVAAATSNFRIRIFVTRGTHDDPSPTTATTTTPKPEFKEATVQNPHPSSISSDSTEMKEDTFSIHQPSSSASLNSGNTKHPDLATQLTEFISRTVSGPTRVVASGPLSMIRDLRSAVAQSNDASRVWKGEERFDVQLVHDDRLEY
jgi:ferric-chelate reductase